MEKVKKFFATTTGKVVGIFIVLVIVGSIASSDDKKSPSSGSPKSTVATAAPVDPAKLEADKARLAELKKKFNYKYDEFQEKGWYEAKTQTVANTFDKKMLKVNVNNVGFAYLSDQYYAEDWLFHTRLEVKIGDTLYKTDDVPTYDPHNQTNNSGGSIWEFIDYTAGKDNGIIKAIAESGTAPIRVRFTGGQGVDDITLAERDRQAIKDAYELSNLIIETGDTGTQS